MLSYSNTAVDYSVCEPDVFPCTHAHAYVHGNTSDYCQHTRPYCATYERTMARLEELKFDNRALNSLPIEEEKENYVRSVSGQRQMCACAHIVPVL